MEGSSKLVGDAILDTDTHTCCMIDHPTFQLTSLDLVLQAGRQVSPSVNLLVSIVTSG